MRRTGFFSLLWLCLNVSYICAQADCVLGVGVTNDTVISNVFQLNEAQKQQLLNFGAEVKYRNGLLNTELRNIKERHPQSTVTELRNLAEKYKEVMDSMARVQTMLDKRMLALFNPKQYQLYQSLCKEASRSPFLVEPTVYSDSLYHKN
ncbi:hypothetical protein [Maribacter sp. MAR_2009_72]|uniref:hypothetical protein n=1 Tax=Maribacter sp. MAR_2009_72 TaxID=1250050 RepID=UPI00119B10FB|nr:hypothetical protein [Maribacter sp. MAR_2009_72]TVZ17180.1 hypothetical protein JM81_3458 [Maribacter sp. MAR_2009_72]